jgi:hypothetical protein
VVDHRRSLASDDVERPDGGVLRILEGSRLVTLNESVDGAGLEPFARILGFIYLVEHRESGGQAGEQGAAADNRRARQLGETRTQMTIPCSTKRRWMIVCIILSVYGLGYFVARQNHLLVHRVGYETQASGAKRYYHYLDEGGSGPGLVLRDGPDLAYWVFTPLRWAEILVWHLFPRSYEFRNAA